MEIMNQERYLEYKKQLKEQGYNVIETITNHSTEETYKILEERIGSMPWNLMRLNVSS